MTTDRLTPEWISVDDELPPALEWVLVAEKSGALFFGCHHESKVEGFGWWESEVDRIVCQDRSKTVTHWKRVHGPEKHTRREAETE